MSSTDQDLQNLHIGAHEGPAFAPPGDDDASSQSSGPLDDIRNGLKAWFDVGLTIGKSVDRMETNVRKMMDRLQRNTPVDYGYAAAGPAPAGADLLLNLGTPDQGTRWEVTSLLIGGADANIAAAGTAAAYVGAMVPQNNQPAPGGFTNVADLAPALPFVRFYGTRQLVVNDSENLFVVIFGGTAAQLYVANFSATVFNVAAAGGKDANIL
jgi:hypothetical protein